MSPSQRLSSLLFVLLWAVSFSAGADYTFNMTPGITEISRGIHHLHMTIFWICVAIGTGVFGVMFYAIIWHRKSRGVTAAQFHESTVVEIIWTLIPFTILILMAIPAAQLLLKMHDTAESDLSIKIVAHQWYWEYEYLGEDVKVISRLATPQDQINNRDVKGQHYLREVDNPLVVPEKKKIRFLTTSNDVIHAWWVPALGIKRDAIPGFINEAWTKIDHPGTYRGQCAELCGALHGFMPIVLEVKTDAEYQTWLTAKKAENVKPTPQSIQSNTP
jgi:cytochrome c oxidase subunit 2